MSDESPGANEEQGKPAQDATSPSRRRVLKAAAAATPIIMSIKGRPAFANNRDHDDKDKKSHSMSHNMSQKPSKKKG
jgi:hypothetical protein